MGQKDEIILININGTDRPGVTAALTEILAKNNAVILDIGQADIHNNLSLGILFQSSEGNSGDILKELLFKSYELDVNIRFNPITEEAYNQWVSMQGKNRYILTLLGRKLTAKQIAAVTGILAETRFEILMLSNVLQGVFHWMNGKRMYGLVSNSPSVAPPAKGKRCNRR